MSIVRYTNKQTGVVTVYESTSYYDPILKQSRPKRKYLGIEDPVTHEIIPSSGKRGRKPVNPVEDEHNGEEYREMYLRLQKEQQHSKARIEQLEEENEKLAETIRKLMKAIRSVDRAVAPLCGRNTEESEEKAEKTDRM